MAQETFIHLVIYELWISPKGSTPLFSRAAYRAFPIKREALNYFMTMADRISKRQDFNYTDMEKLGFEQQFIFKNGDCYKLRYLQVPFNSYQPINPYLNI